jgi:hypothetical protein
MIQSDLIALISGKEPEAIIRALGMMAYIPAIGRVLEKGGVDRFADLMVQTIPNFYGTVSHNAFNAIHAQTCEEILSSFKTSRNETLSYGQAQKPLNVFLKVYVDWAKQPTRELAEKLTPLLHVPLDSLLMGFISREFSDKYHKRIVPLQERFASFVADRMGIAPAKARRMLLANQFSLVGINHDMYLAWQELLRELYPAKPIALDVIWVLERMRLRSEGIIAPAI